MTILNQVIRETQDHPNVPAVADPDGSWTYRELLASAANVATHLREHTSSDPSGSPDRVGLLLKKGRPFASAFLGVLGAGRVPVPLNFLVGADPLSSISTSANLSLVLSSRALSDLTDELPVEIQSVSDVIGGVNPGFSGGDGPSDLLQPDLDRPATILFTSGTTGLPKGVPLTRKNLGANIQGCRRAMGIGQEEQFLSSLPLFHSFGLTCGLLLPLTSGSSTFLLPEFSPARFLNALRRQTATITLAIPTQYRMIARAAEREGTSSHLHERHEEVCMFCGGEPLPTSISDRIRSALGRPVLEGYGLTETAPVISVNRPDNPARGTAGRPLHNVRVRIADPDNPDQSVDSDEKGEIQVRGPSVMDGYLRDRTDDGTFAGPDWFRTGDIGVLTEDGHLKVTGRLKNLIISAGENVAPAEIEEVLSSHPDVAQAAVLGVPDENRGEVPVAFVLREDERDMNTTNLQSFVRERLGRIRTPRDIYVVDEYPRGPTGKVQKRVLAEQINEPSS